MLEWKYAGVATNFSVTENPARGLGWKQNSRLHVNRDGSERSVMIDDDAAFSTVAFVRHEHWLLVVCRGVDQVWAGYDYSTGRLYGEGEWSLLPFTHWSRQGTVVAERRVRDSGPSPARFPPTTQGS